MVAHLPTAGTRRHQLRDGGVGSEALQVQRRSVGAGPGGFPISMGADAGQTGEAVSVVPEARQSSRRLDTARRQRPTLPEVSQTSVGCHVTKEVPNVLAGAARPTGLRVDGRLSLKISRSLASLAPTDDDAMGNLNCLYDCTRQLRAS